jgi:hypothetical protein
LHDPVRRLREIVVDEFLQRLRNANSSSGRQPTSRRVRVAAGVRHVGQQFGWPETVRRGITIALAIGFFITIVLAWYHGSAARNMSGTEPMLVALLLGIGGGVVLAFRAGVARQVDHGAPRRSANSTGGAAVREHIRDKGNEYFSDGMTETLLDRLARCRN